jgi:hypothetical protein
MPLNWQRPGSGGNLKESLPGWVMFKVNHLIPYGKERRLSYGQET